MTTEIFINFIRLHFITLAHTLVKSVGPPQRPNVLRNDDQMTTHNRNANTQ